MEESAVQGFLSPVTADMLVVLSIVINVILLFAFAYLWTTRQQDERFTKMEASIKKVSTGLKNLENRVQEIKPARTVENLPQAEPFGMSFRQPHEEEEKKISKSNDSSAAWNKFVEDYNHIAESMAVPGQVQACEKFTSEKNLRLLFYADDMTFLPSIDVEESSYWAWKVPNTQDVYAVVPNPLKPCNEELYETGGLKIIFAMNYRGGSYGRYIVETPAIFEGGSSGKWKLQEPGVIDLARF